MAELIRGQDLQALSFNQLLEKLSIAWSMSLEELEPHKEAARSILDKLVRKELARQLVEGDRSKAWRGPRFGRRSCGASFID